MCRKTILLMSIVSLLAVAGVTGADSIINQFEDVSAGDAKWGAEPERTVDNSGMTGDLHDTDWLNMWIGTANTAGMAYPGCVTGENWIAYEMEGTYTLTRMQVWNYNEGGMSSAGVKNVTIEYSMIGGSDSSEWTTLMNGGSSTWQIPEADGLPNHPYDIEIDFADSAAKYVVISPNQGINDGWWGNGLYNGYLGLSEVRFFGLPLTATDPTTGDTAKAVELDIQLT